EPGETPDHICDRNIMTLMKLARPFFVLTLVFLAGSARAQGDAGKNAKPKYILIIRHGEKTGEKGDIHLSKKGVERAAELHRIFEMSKDRPDPFPMPDFIFAAKNSSDSQRPVETVTPLSEKLKLTINKSFKSKSPLDGKSDIDPAVTMIGLKDEIF